MFHTVQNPEKLIYFKFTPKLNKIKKRQCLKKVFRKTKTLHTGYDLSNMDKKKTIRNKCNKRSMENENVETSWTVVSNEGLKLTLRRNRVYTSAPVKVEETAADIDSNKVQQNILGTEPFVKQSSLDIPLETAKLRQSLERKCKSNPSLYDTHTNSISLSQEKFLKRNSSQKRNKKNTRKQRQKQLQRTSKIKTQSQELCMPPEEIPGTSSKVEIFEEQQKDKTQNNDDLIHMLNMIAMDCPIERYQNNARQLRAQQIILDLQPKLKDMYDIHDKRELTAICSYLYFNIMEKLSRGQFNVNRDIKSLLFEINCQANESRSTSAIRSIVGSTENEKSSNDMVWVPVRSQETTSSPSLGTNTQTQEDCTNFPQKDVHSKPSNTRDIEYQGEDFSIDEATPEAMNTAEPLKVQKPTGDSQHRKLRETLTKLRSQVRAITKLEKITVAKQTRVHSCTNTFRPLGEPENSEVLDRVYTKSQISNVPKTPNGITTAFEGMMIPGYQHVSSVNQDYVCRGTHQVYSELKPSLERFFIQYNIHGKNMRNVIKQYVSLRIMQKIRNQIELQLNSKGSSPDARNLSTQPRYMSDPGQGWKPCKGDHSNSFGI